MDIPETKDVLVRFFQPDPESFDVEYLPILSLIQYLHLPKCK